MKANKFLLLIPILLTGCSINVDANKSVTNEIDSGSIVNNSDESVTASSEKEFDNTPYNYEPATVVLPEDGKLNRDWIGRRYDSTNIRTLFMDSDYIIVDGMFDREWQYNEVLQKKGSLAYASIDHKPALQFDSVLVSDVNQLPDTYRYKNTNIDIQLGSYKDYLNKHINIKSNTYSSTLVYHAKASAIYYTESFPNIGLFKKECISHLNVFFLKDVKEACSKNTKEGYAEFFRENGTHVIWSCGLGIGTEFMYEAYSNDYDLKGLTNSGVKDLYDRAVLSGIESKTVGEYEEKSGFNLKNYLNVQDEKYLFEHIFSGTVYGGPACFPPMTISGVAKTVNELTTLRVADVRQSAFLTPMESYPVWEFLPSTMNEEKAKLKNAYDEYVIDRAEYYKSQYNA